MDEMTCPKCQGSMAARTYAGATVRQCAECHGVFLDRADLGALNEAENDWHAHLSTDTAQLPRITSDMTSPPPVPAKSRSFVEALFKG